MSARTPFIPVILPRFGMTMEEGTIVRWLRAEGEMVEKGEPIAEVATDKVNMEVEAPASGILRGVRAQPGDTVSVTHVIAYITGPGEEVPDTRSVLPASPPPVPASPPGGTGEAATGPGVPRGAAGAAAREDAPSTTAATPVARRLAKEARLDLSAVTGTGPGGRITEADVRAALAGGAVPSPAALPVTPAAPSLSAPAGSPASSRMPLSHRRRVIAERMSRSARDIPHIYLMRDVDMSAAGAARGAASYTAVVMWAAARALRTHPLMRASLEGDAVVVHEGAHVGVAVDTGEGLIVPVVRDADAKDLARLHQEIEDMVHRARQGRLALDDVTGGTFTISNLGMFGVDAFTALINPPQSALLAAGAVRPRPWVVGQALGVRPVCTLTLAVDHRIADGAAGARFLGDVCRALEAMPA
ncbi:MAG: 2-oxo acid dehydrogenase subunit E2 [Armatimonadetes bacterium]|nr:2-oxo acid dehydrogenase subunit E2 [Armatimonadota bacterium]